MARGQSQCGFSVIELMVLLALVCIVAAIGVPNFVEMQYRAQRAEVPANLEGIRYSAIAYQSAHGRLITEDIPRPDAFPGQRERPWKSGSRFDDLGWEPEGEVRGSYAIATTTRTAFKVKGFCDVDGNGEQAVFEGSERVPVSALSGSKIY